MSSKSIDSALDFLPSEQPQQGLWATLKAFFGAASEGLDALHKYKKLTSHGVSAADAAKAVLKK